MRIYKITYQINEDHGTNETFPVTKTCYSASQQDAGSKRANIRKIDGYIPNSVQTSPLDIDTRKNALIEFLNHDGHG